MSKTKSDNEKILAALENLNKRVEDLFVLQASLAGIGQREIRAMLGIERIRVTRVAKHAKRENRKDR